MREVGVSVIVPIYNVRPWLAECLDSLERQTLKNIEVILVDDGSTDGSDKLAKVYVDRNDNFTLITRPNGGLSAARNTGMKKASGEYIYFLDSDDYLVDGALEILYKKAKADELDVLKFTAYTFNDGSNDMTWQRENGYKYVGNYPDIYNGVDALSMFIDNGDIYPSCCLMFTRREVIIKNSVCFEEGIIHEDNLFQWQILSLSDRVGIINQPLYHRRFRIGSITQTPDHLKRIYSMYISAVRADEFMESHPRVRGYASEWQILFFAYLQMEYWNETDFQMRRNPILREYIKKTKPIVKKYGYDNNIRLRLFYTCIPLYCMLKSMKGYLERC